MGGDTRPQSIARRKVLLRAAVAALVTSVRAMSSDVRDRLRAGISAAMKQRDRSTVAVLRSALAALDNAEAVPAQEHGHESLAIEATPVGVGVREVARRDLSDDDLVRLLHAEIGERRDAARMYEQVGQHERARELDQEADTLSGFTGPAVESDPRR